MILKIKTTRQDICNVKCFIEPNCLSYNVGPLDENHQYLCEINDSDEVLHPGDLVRRSGFAYQGTQVFLEFDFVQFLAMGRAGVFCFTNRLNHKLGKTKTYPVTKVSVSFVRTN